MRSGALPLISAAVAFVALVGCAAAHEEESGNSADAVETGASLLFRTAPGTYLGKSLLVQFVDAGAGRIETRIGLRSRANGFTQASGMLDARWNSATVAGADMARKPFNLRFSKVGSGVQIDGTVFGSQIAETLELPPVSAWRGAYGSPGLTPVVIETISESGAVVSGIRGTEGRLSMTWSIAGVELTNGARRIQLLDDAIEVTESEDVHGYTWPKRP